MCLIIRQVILPEDIGPEFVYQGELGVGVVGEKFGRRPVPDFGGQCAAQGRNQVGIIGRNNEAEAGGGLLERSRSLALVGEQIEALLQYFTALNINIAWVRLSHLILDALPGHVPGYNGSICRIEKICIRCVLVSYAQFGPLEVSVIQENEIQRHDSHCTR